MTKRTEARKAGGNGRVNGNLGSTIDVISAGFDVRLTGRLFVNSSY